MISEALFRQVPNYSFQIGDVACFFDDSSVRILENKRTKTVIFQNVAAQVV